MKKKKKKQSSPGTGTTATGAKKTKEKKPKKEKKPTLLALSNMPEKLGGAGPDRELCQKCSLVDRCEKATPWIPEDWTGKLLLVGPPPEADNDYIRPLRAKIGKWLRGMAADLGFDSNDLGFVSAIRCAEPKPSMDQLRCCRPFLLHVINKLKPEGILGLGKFALKAITNSNNQNITKARGKNLEVPGVERPMGSGR